LPPRGRPYRMIALQSLRRLLPRPYWLVGTAALLLVPGCQQQTVVVQGSQSPPPGATQKEPGDPLPAPNDGDTTPEEVPSPSAPGKPAGDKPPAAKPSRNPAD